MQDNEDNRRVKLVSKSTAKKSKKDKVLNPKSGTLITKAKLAAKPKMSKTDALKLARETRAKRLAEKKEKQATSNVAGALRQPKNQKSITKTKATKMEVNSKTTVEKSDADNFENKPNLDTNIIENPSNKKTPASDEHPLDKSVVGHKSLLKTVSNRFSRSGVDPSQVSPEPVEQSIANSNTYIDTTLNTKSSQMYYFPRSQNDGIIFTD